MTLARQEGFTPAVIRTHPFGSLGLFTLLACTGSSPMASPADAMAPSDLTQSPDLPQNPDLGASPDTDPAPDSSGITADLPPGQYYLPPGTSLTPFLSTERVATFASADMVLSPGRDYLAVLETDVGRMVLDLTESQTPITVNSFVFLARNHFFDGILFHRVIRGFVAQGGDPNTLSATRTRWGSGGPGYNFGVEIVPELRFDGRGVLGMARAASRNSNGSQFYITLGPTPSLNDQYTVFGRLTDGSDTLDALALGEPPREPTRINRLYVVER